MYAYIYVCVCIMYAYMYSWLDKFIYLGMYVSLMYTFMSYVWIIVCMHMGVCCMSVSLYILLITYTLYILFK